MKYVKMQPPGSWCNHQAVKDIVKRHFPSAKTFVDVGCGGGDLSKILLDMKLKGTGTDYSKDAIAVAENNLHREIASSRYRLALSDLTRDNTMMEKHDFGKSSMVMEHIEDDVGFVKKCCSLVKSGGHFVFAVPGRMDLWSLEDETVGHLRRYERDTLMHTLLQGGMKNPQVYSVAVPISNWLFGLSKFAVAIHKEKAKQTQMSQEHQTKVSGIQEIPWKTVFPAWVGLILNRYTLYPLFELQRLFYHTNLGVVIIGWGEVQHES